MYDLVAVVAPEVLFSEGLHMFLAFVHIDILNS
jgi:hypothetical protein